ncbi:hypothetical protein NA57DRAFT_81927 [Rhizodiscina lignyota]|uniref:Transmembrane protein n=1 Tax=Rhizodiscina lignyota TaxID=1504668 RepID=A0A9P4I3E9_9PEZI|nr:hypothetical protein NA57DRAFT_81927 [Rhizodiscina lignyota]
MGLRSTVLQHTLSLPWQRSMTFDPIVQILNAATPIQEQKTRAWIDAKLGELSFVGLTVLLRPPPPSVWLRFRSRILQSALVTAVFAGGFSWNNLTTTGFYMHTVRGVWYGGLAMALVAIALAMQQSVALQRLSSNDSGMEKLRLSFGYPSPSGWKPRFVHVFIWQIPVMLLNVSIFLFILGLLILMEDFKGMRADDQ